MSGKSDAIGALESSYQAFRGKIAPLPEAAYRETWLGTWSLEQLLAHMAGWFREMSGAFARVERGERPAPPGVDYGNADAWNEGFARQAKAGAAALADWDAAFAQYRDAALTLDEDKYGVDPESGRPRIGNRLLQGAGIGHFEEHQRQLEEWLASRK
jgi:hypothetical protein